MQIHDDLPGFDEPRTFCKSRDRPRLRAVDTPGYEDLHPVWPVTAEGLRAYLRLLAERGECVSYPYLHKQRVYANLVARLAALPPDARPRFLARRVRETYRVDGSLDDDGLYDLMRECLQSARRAVDEYNARFIPEIFRAPFTSEGTLEAKTDPVEMLLEIRNTPWLALDPREPSDYIKRVRLFALRRELVLGERLFAIWHKLQDITAGRPFEKFITDVLEDRFFTRGVERQFMVRVAVDRETGDPLRVLGPEETAAAGEYVPVPMPCRYFQDRSGRQLPVFFDPGQKKQEAVLFKMMDQRVTDPLKLHDLFRFQMVFRSECELGLGIQRLVEEVFPMVGSMSSMKDTRRTVRDRDNPLSSEEYRAINVNFTYGGYVFEGQFHAFENYARSRLSRGPVNHKQYERRRAANVLPMLNPTEIFGVDWTDPDIRRLVAGDATG